MSNPDSFIDEVTEEVRRDRLYSLVRRWGWLVVLVIVLLVGGAAWTEWQKSQREAESQVFGDAVLAALTGGEPATRRIALSEVSAANEAQVAILALLQAAASAGGDDADPETARIALLSLAEAPELSPIYRDLALLKVILDGGTGDAARDAEILERLAIPGAPYRPLAIEQQAIAALAAGDDATAVTLLRVLTEEAGVTETLRRRAGQLIVALGASPDPA